MVKHIQTDVKQKHNAEESRQLGDDSIWYVTLVELDVVLYYMPLENEVIRNIVMIICEE